MILKSNSSSFSIKPVPLNALLHGVPCSLISGLKTKVICYNNQKPINNYKIFNLCKILDVIYIFDSYMVQFLRQLHRLWFLFWLLFFFFLFYPIYYFCSRNPKYYGVLNFFRKLNSSLCSLLSGIFYSFHFEEKLNNKQTYIYCANHTSNLDIMIFCILAKRNFHFMGKDELLNNPVLGIFFRTIDISVNRESKISGYRAFKKAGENLDKGMSLIIFPEGKIDDYYPPKLHEFKNGPFRLAIEKNIALVPVSIINAWKVMCDDGVKYGSKPGICDIYIHKPIETLNFVADEADRLKEKVFNLVKSKLI